MSKQGQVPFCLTNLHYTNANCAMLKLEEQQNRHNRKLPSFLWPNIRGQICPSRVASQCQNHSRSISFLHRRPSRATIKKIIHTLDTFSQNIVHSINELKLPLGNRITNDDKALTQRYCFQQEKPQTIGHKPEH